MKQLTQKGSQRYRDGQSCADAELGAGAILGWTGYATVRAHVRLSVPSPIHSSAHDLIPPIAYQRVR